MSKAASLVHEWNGTTRLKEVAFEEDFRDALQAVRVRRPPTDERIRLLELAVRTGVDLFFLGFPAVSAPEREQCVELLGHLHRLQGGLPVLMARAVSADVEAVDDVRQTAGLPVLTDLYIATSALRAAVEDRAVEDMRGRLRDAARRADDLGLPFRVAFEDSSRTTPRTLGDCVREAVVLGARSIVLNDTVGASLPSGAFAQAAFVADVLRDEGVALPICWHGHNDKGLALANALAAVEAGATQVSGTFLGIGERSGNIPLEQVMWLAHEAGHTGVSVQHLTELCSATAAALGLAVPPDQPLVGSDAFSTSTGTHTAALVKARRLGADFEDLVYSDVPATSLGRTQSLMVGPNSGRAGVTALLAHYGLDASPETVDVVLYHCRAHGATLQARTDVLAVLATRRTPQVAK